MKALFTTLALVMSLNTAAYAADKSLGSVRLEFAFAKLTRLTFLCMSSESWQKHLADTQTNTYLEELEKLCKKFHSKGQRDHEPELLEKLERDLKGDDNFFAKIFPEVASVEQTPAGRLRLSLVEGKDAFIHSLVVRCNEATVESDSISVETMLTKNSPTLDVDLGQDCQLTKILVYGLTPEDFAARSKIAIDAIDENTEL